MYAFGLEENGEYRLAEKFARDALAVDPMHVGAIHAMVHVLEMEARAREGLALLADNEAAWSEGNGYLVHLAWHRALFHLELDEVSEALAVYDRKITNAASGDSHIVQCFRVSSFDCPGLVGEHFLHPAQKGSSKGYFERFVRINISNLPGFCHSTCNVDKRLKKAK